NLQIVSFKVTSVIFTLFRFVVNTLTRQQYHTLLENSTHAHLDMVLIHEPSHAISYINKHLNSNQTEYPGTLYNGDGTKFSTSDFSPCARRSTLGFVLLHIACRVSFFFFFFFC